MAETSRPAQEFVPIKEIRDGIVVLKDGSMRSLLLASSLNFALKSGDEQQAIIYQFQDFLNSLDFSVQICIQSRRLDIRPYLATLEERLRVETGELLRIQIREYIEFIRSFTQNTSIMTKSFFVVIPYSPVIIPGAASSVTGFFGGGKGKTAEAAKKDDFEENRSQLEQRIGIVQQGLTRCGVRIAQLGTEEIVELYYRMFNPGDTEKPIQTVK